MKAAIHVTTNVKRELNLNKAAIIQLLNAQGMDIPPCASVVFYVPGGGDYSHCKIDVDDEWPVTVTWEVKQQLHDEAVEINKL